MKTIAYPTGSNIVVLLEVFLLVFSLSQLIVSRVVGGGVEFF